MRRSAAIRRCRPCPTDRSPRDGKQVYFDTEGPNLIGYYNANGDSSDYDPATDTKVFTMTLASTGAYTFTLHAPVDQPIGGEDSIAINLNGRVTVTDSGGPGGRH